MYSAFDVTLYSYALLFEIDFFLFSKWVIQIASAADSEQISPLHTVFSYYLEYRIFNARALNCTAIWWLYILKLISFMPCFFISIIITIWTNQFPNCDLPYIFLALVKSCISSFSVHTHIFDACLARAPHIKMQQPLQCLQPNYLVNSPWSYFLFARHMLQTTSVTCVILQHSLHHTALLVIYLLAFIRFCTQKVVINQFYCRS